MEDYAVKPMMLYVIGEVSFPVGELKTIAFDMNSATGQAFRINQATAGVKARDVSRQFAQHGPDRTRPLVNFSESPENQVALIRTISAGISFTA